eukprot:PhF_6_TR4513/c0_g1_i3/m.6290/K08285/TRIM18, MID1; midline 1
MSEETLSPPVATTTTSKRTTTATIETEDHVLEDEAVCTVCLELYVDPVLLECAHNMCYSCAKQLFDFETKVHAVQQHHIDDDKQQQQQHQITCPECRHVTQIVGPQGVDGLKRNHVLRNVIETLKERRAAASRQQQALGNHQPMCGVCEEKPAVVECKECQSEMCGDCKESLHSRGRMREHIFFPLGKLAKLRPQKCKEHDGYGKDLYCIQCHHAVCLLCSHLGEHKGHAVEPIATAVDRYRADLRVKLEAMEVKAKGVEEAAQKHRTVCEEKCRTLDQQRDQTTLSIKEYFVKLHAVLSAREDALLRQVSELYTQQVDSMLSCEDAFRVILSQMHETSKTCRSLLESDIAELLRSKESMLNRLQSMCDVDVTSSRMSRDDVSDVGMSFEPRDDLCRTVLDKVGVVLDSRQAKSNAQPFFSMGSQTCGKSKKCSFELKTERAFSWTTPVTPRTTAPATTTKTTASSTPVVTSNAWGAKTSSNNAVPTTAPTAPPVATNSPWGAKTSS